MLVPKVKLVSPLVKSSGLKKISNKKKEKKRINKWIDRKELKIKKKILKKKNNYYTESSSSGISIITKVLKLGLFNIVQWNFNNWIINFNYIYIYI